MILFVPGLVVTRDEPALPRVLINAENVPRTRQTRRQPPPPKPTVPVPSDDETIPDDVTIEETDLKYTTIFDFEIGDAPAFAGIKITPPRPIAWVFPEYPDEEKKRGAQGVVKLSIHIDEKGKVTEVVARIIPGITSIRPAIVSRPKMIGGSEIRIRIALADLIDPFFGFPVRLLHAACEA